MLSRALIALLLTMNLGVALWLWLRPAPESVVPQSHGDDQTPSLILLSEEEYEPDATESVAEPDSPPEPTPGLDRLACVEIGPFRFGEVARVTPSRFLDELPAAEVHYVGRDAEQYAERTQEHAGAAIARLKALFGE